MARAHEAVKTHIQTFAAAKAPPDTGHWFRCSLRSAIGRERDGRSRVSQAERGPNWPVKNLRI
ncbi:MAG: hypothetical protein AVDCRST_MAG93-1901 [uncultured Chloroflexia bacterium]|uniref:Uncharacterized protein n=1 Tax=uncultured Chloroflexia bacterium TaxID=1672391 RepID=A0A6J4INA3_9CHLR|nr:MAG: hypothetical protein AVDCRST_MAG93-1901 [uncultured Chloroflexia bacterium]